MRREEKHNIKTAKNQNNEINNNMKKLIIGLVLIMLPFFMVSQTFNFDKKGDTEGWKVSHAISHVADGVLRIVPKNSINPSIRFTGGILANEAKYCHIKIRNYGNSANTIRFYFARASDPEKDFFINANMATNSSDFVIITLPTDALKPIAELTDLDGWKDTVKHITFRFTDRETTLNENDLIEIDQIVFDNNPRLL